MSLIIHSSHSLSFTLKHGDLHALAIGAGPSVDVLASSVGSNKGHGLHRCVRCATVEMVNQYISVGYREREYHTRERVSTCGFTMSGRHKEAAGTDLCSWIIHLNLRFVAHEVHTINSSVHLIHTTLSVHLSNSALRMQHLARP